MTFKLCDSLRNLYPSLEAFTTTYLQNRKHNLEQATQFLSALSQTSNINSEKFCFQIIKQPDAADLPSDVSWALASHRTGSFAFCESWLTQANLPAHGGLCGAYVTVNATDGKGRKATNVVSVRALFVELDHGSLSHQHIVEFQSRFRPSILVESSPGKLHCYWLVHPKSVPLEKFPQCQQLLQARFESLRAGKEAKDLPRVLRIPGFLHLKDLNAPFVVTLHHCDSGAVYSPDQVFSLCEIDSEFVKRFQSSGAGTSRASQSVSPEILASVDPIYNEFLGAQSGSRNEAMYHYCLKHLFQHKGLNRPEALAICKDANQSNNPPLELPELESIVQSAWKRFQAHGGISAPPPGLALQVLPEWSQEGRDKLPRSYLSPDGSESWEEANFSFDYDPVLMRCPVSDESLAERIIQKYGSKINHADVGGFYVYNDLIWANAHGEGRRIVRAWMGETFSHVPYEPQVQAYFAAPKGGLDGKRWGAFTRDIHSTFRIKSVLTALSERKEIATTSDQFNREEESDVIACPNGILDLPSGRLVNPDPKYRLTHLLGTRYDSLARCPTWDYFVSSCMGDDAELIKYIQKVTGYFLSGRTHLQCIFLAYGRPGTGKSVYLNVLNKLLAGYCKELSKNVLILGGSENARLSSLAQAIHCRLATVQEVKASEAWDEALVKALSGNDPITAKLSHKDVISFTPRFKVCVRANDLPTSDQLDEALWDRLKFLPFEVRFRGTEKEDSFLGEKLGNELPGILNWAVKGYQMLMLEGLGEPAQAKAQKIDSQRESEPVRVFIEECCQMTAHKDGLKFTEFQSAYEHFCRDRGVPTHGKYRIRKLLFNEYGFTETGAKVVELGYSVRRVNINLKPEYRKIYSIKSNVVDIKKDM